MSFSPFSPSPGRQPWFPCPNFRDRFLAHRQRRRLLGRQPRCASLLARDGQIDVLTLEYLAELTMAILSHLRSKDPRAGFVTDFPELVERLAPILVEKEALRIVTNAGGLNPPSCAPALRRDPQERPAWATQPIGVVTGDDVLGPDPRVDRRGDRPVAPRNRRADLERGLAAGGRQRLPGGAGRSRRHFNRARDSW